MPAISFKTTVFAIGAWAILRLPDSASRQLPSRGQVMVKGTLNGVPIQTPLEPDGKGSHWFRLDAQLQKTAKAAAGNSVIMTIEPTKEWPEPPVPADWQAALAGDAQARALWQRITPMARWEWIRWARATNSAETRKKRITVGLSKMRAGKRRPCCWNRNLSTEPAVSKNGVLLEPDQ